MATVKVIDCIKEVSERLKDTSDPRRWPNEQLLTFFNNAQLAVCSRRPDANSKIIAFTCVAGYRQVIPEQYLRLLNVPSSTGGGSILKVDTGMVDQLNRSWRMMAPSADTRYFLYDERYPKYFELFPPVQAGHSVDIAVSVAPEPVEINDYFTDGQVIGIDDVWKNAIESHMRYQAYAVDAEYASQSQEAQSEYQIFLNEIGQKTEADTATSPQNG